MPVLPGRCAASNAVGRAHSSKTESDGFTRGRNQKWNRGCCSLLDSDPPSKSLIILRSSKRGTSERLTITRVLVPRFAELTQLQTFAKQKAILANQKYFKRM